MSSVGAPARAPRRTAIFSRPSSASFSSPTTTTTPSGHRAIILPRKRGGGGRPRALSLPVTRANDSPLGTPRPRSAPRQPLVSAAVRTTSDVTAAVAATPLVAASAAAVEAASSSTDLDDPPPTLDAMDTAPSAAGTMSRRSQVRAMWKKPTAVLKTWLLQHRTHPFPTEDEEQRLADMLGLNKMQVRTWFRNARRRLLLARSPLSSDSEGAGVATVPTDGPLEPLENIDAMFVTRSKAKAMVERTLRARQPAPSQPQPGMHVPVAQQLPTYSAVQAALSTTRGSASAPGAPSSTSPLPPSFVALADVCSPRSSAGTVPPAASEDDAGDVLMVEAGMDAGQEDGELPMDEDELPMDDDHAAETLVDMAGRSATPFELGDTGSQPMDATSSQFGASSQLILTPITPVLANADDDILDNDVHAASAAAAQPAEQHTAMEIHAQPAVPQPEASQQEVSQQPEASQSQQPEASQQEVSQQPEASQQEVSQQPEASQQEVSQQPEASQVMAVTVRSAREGYASPSPKSAVSSPSASAPSSPAASLPSSPRSSGSVYVLVTPTRRLSTSSDTIPTDASESAPAVTAPLAVSVEMPPPTDPPAPPTATTTASETHEVTGAEESRAATITADVTLRYPVVVLPSAVSQDLVAFSAPAATSLPTNPLQHVSAPPQDRWIPPSPDSQTSSQTSSQTNSHSNAQISSQIVDLAPPPPSALPAPAFVTPLPTTPAPSATFNGIPITANEMAWLATSPPSAASTLAPIDNGAITMPHMPELQRRAEVLLGTNDFQDGGEREALLEANRVLIERNMVLQQIISTRLSSSSEIVAGTEPGQHMSSAQMTAELDRLLQRSPISRDGRFIRSVFQALRGIDGVASPDRLMQFAVNVAAQAMRDASTDYGYIAPQPAYLPPYPHQQPARLPQLLPPPPAAFASSPFGAYPGAQPSRQPSYFSPYFE